MEEILLSLLCLDELDRKEAKRQKEKRAAGDPEAKRRDLLASLAAAAAKEKEEKERLARERSSFRQLELDLRASEERLAAEEKKLYGGEVTNPKELAQLEHRVAEERRRREELENRYLSLLEALEKTERALAAAREELRRNEEALTIFEKEQERLAAEEELHTREYEAAREALLARLPALLREKYERLQARYPGSAVARIEAASCSGCHTALSQAEMERAARSPGQTTCENCGRLLVPSRADGKGRVNSSKNLTQRVTDHSP
ncbi:MAG: CT398-like coiled coil hairpin domain-containing protein, partial [Bacillota bacterium]